MWPFRKKTEGPENPSSEDWERIYNYAPFTPDIALLQQRKTQLLFVYDEMQRGHPDFRLIEEYSVPLGVVFTRDPFVLYKRKLGENSYAIALEESPFKAKKGPIRGELHAIDPSRYIELDTIYQNGVEFNRRRISVLMPYLHIGWKKDGGMFKEYRVEAIRCFMYVGIQEHWSLVMSNRKSVNKNIKYLEEGGWTRSETEYEVAGEDGFFLFDKVRMFDPKNPDLTRYYSFTKLEYEDN